MILLSKQTFEEHIIKFDLCIFQPAWPNHETWGWESGKASYLLAGTSFPSPCSRPGSSRLRSPSSGAGTRTWRRRRWRGGSSRRRNLTLYKNLLNYCLKIDVVCFNCAYMIFKFHENCSCCRNHTALNNQRNSHGFTSSPFKAISSKRQKYFTYMIIPPLKL